jgi:hypothetical protein
MGNNEGFTELLIVVFIVLPTLVMIGTLFALGIQKFLKKLKEEEQKKLFIVSVYHGGYGHYQIKFNTAQNRDFIWGSTLFEGVTKNRSTFEELGEFYITYDFSSLPPDKYPNVYHVQQVVLDYVNNYKG